MTLPRKQETAISKQQTRRPCDLAAAILPVLRWSDVFLCASVLLRLPFPISMNTHIWLFYKWRGHYPLRWQNREKKSVVTPAVNVLNSKCVSDWSYPWLLSYYSFFFLHFCHVLQLWDENGKGKPTVRNIYEVMHWFAGRISCFRLAPMKDLFLHPVDLMLLALKNTSYSVSSINHCAFFYLLFPCFLYSNINIIQFLLFSRFYAS